MDRGNAQRHCVRSTHPAGVHRFGGTGSGGVTELHHRLISVRPSGLRDDVSYVAQARLQAHSSNAYSSSGVQGIPVMPSTHLSLHYHLVFATKERRPLIVPAWRERLHAYLGGILNEMKAVPQAVGGVADHVHLLVGLKATHRLADVLRDLKRGSSEWVHGTIGDRTFAWQEGYGAFTVSANVREGVRTYIARQEEHHRTRTFQEEYLEFLRRGGVEFDERYVD